MARIPSLNRTLSSTIPFARGVADRAVSAAGPIVGGVVGRVAAHLPRRSGPSPSVPETFAPSPLVDDSVAQSTIEPATTEQQPAPSPATIARNLAGPRPRAEVPPSRKPRSVPGAKLPVSRPNT